MTAKFQPKQPEISRDVLVKVCDLVKEMCGNQLEERQFPMVENRLKTRMIRLQIFSGDEYYAFLKKNQGTEGEYLLSLLTTHHTYFFREFSHFEYLLSKMDTLVAKARQRGDKTIHIWSAASSFGQEVYSLAMFFDFHLKQTAPDVSFRILGTDVDPQSVKIAQNGVYKYEELKSVPANYLGQNWVRGTGDIRDYAKIKPALKDRCSFEVFNLVKPGFKDAKGKFDIIFCRNVFIYLNPEQIVAASKFLLNQMENDGHFFVGISESLTYLPLELDYAGPSVYRKKTKLAVVEGGAKASSSRIGATAPKSESAKTPVLSVVPQAAAVPASPLRVMCVDDSPSILTLLKKILTATDGFEIVATAVNGKDAIEKMKATKVDIVTLDIHMPEMDGIAYLQSQMGPTHPPVVMLSTVHRDNADVALKALKLGAADYIEKPNLSNLEDRGDEIRAKLKMAHLMHKPAKASIDTSFKRKYTVTKPETKACIAFVGIQYRNKLENLLRSLDPKGPVLYLVFEGIGDFAQLMMKELSTKTTLPIQMGLGSNAQSGAVVIVDLEKEFDALSKLVTTKTCSVLMCGKPTKKATKVALKKQGQLVLEDLGDSNHSIYGDLVKQASQVVPMTSFISVSEEFFK